MGKTTARMDGVLKGIGAAAIVEPPGWIGCAWFFERPALALSGQAAQEQPCERVQSGRLVSKRGPSKAQAGLNAEQGGS